MQQKISVRMMTAAEQATLMEFVRIGLKWIAGQMPFEEVVRTLGKPEQFEQPDSIDYAYFSPEMRVHFYLDKRHLIDGKPGIDGFKLEVKEGFYTNIPYETWDGLGLHRLKHGELIDGVRRETGDFFDPTGLRDVTGTDSESYVTFSYRLPLPPDSPFDAGAGFSYLGEWVSEKGGAILSNFRNAVNLRDLGIGRHYLTSEELQQRQQAKRQKYGEMNLRTGMPCPETGIWQGFAANCSPDVAVVWKGKQFPRVRTLTHHEEREQCRPTGRIDGQWMWLKECDSADPRVDE